MRPRCAIAICALLLSFTPGRTQEASDPVQALLEQERIRKLVESALASVTEARGLYLDDTAFVEAYTDIAYELGTADSGVIPLLANETLQADPGTFFFASYALSFHAAPEARLARLPGDLPPTPLQVVVRAVDRGALEAARGTQGRVLLERPARDDDETVLLLGFDGR